MRGEECERGGSGKGVERKNVCTRICEERGGVWEVWEKWGRVGVCVSWLNFHF